MPAPAAHPDQPDQPDDWFPSAATPLLGLNSALLLGAGALALLFSLAT
jgi:hypothetical protein